MRGSKAIETILNILQSGTKTTAALIDVLAFSKEQWAAKYRDRHKFYALLNHLKSQGLVSSEKKGKNSFWRITKKGEEKILVLRERNLYGKESGEYKPENDDTFKIVVYDVPASENRKRWWLRWALGELGFTMFQKSVWLGKKKLPQEFLEDLRERKMLSYVHILEIKKKGTLKEVA